MKLDAAGVRRLRILLHVLAAAPLLWLLWALPAGRLGGDPVPELLHFLGIWALRLLLLTLSISPLARWLRLGALVRLRRALGLWCFAYASLHLLVWLLLDLQLAWGLIGAEIVKRTFITLGMLAWLVLLLLAVTSTQGWQRRLGARWQRLHKGVYLVALLVPVHFWWSVKSGWIEPAFYLALSLGLLYWRRERLFRR
ncbi:sulfoxide reductase heme-binding subunit YedZ [Zobellella taiwanensis]|jgi:sulfoxide reductase heme-binding subunit YedZ|uniref:Protein-methionine-sulfoxide reductase heme-binding subunit MsrQ n=1 Tax=Zobellella taiwanensis TaxID=347535 RepID=A0A2P7QU77_9GAMM|nr:protein-methionine-sulfoxide reductase heme-binding subunit MsrQ [Zobellella taiwanensis]PSJ41505.1 sulfoxide reductase heme-binding subunit YedZ [Zobellella taiwanensis]